MNWQFTEANSAHCPLFCFPNEVWQNQIAALPRSRRLDFSDSKIHVNWGMDFRMKASQLIKAAPAKTMRNPQLPWISTHVPATKSVSVAPKEMTAWSVSMQASSSWGGGQGQGAGFEKGRWGCRWNRHLPLFWYPSIPKCFDLERTKENQKEVIQPKNDHLFCCCFKHKWQCFYHHTS